MTQKTPKFISYKKLAIFGSVGSGKSSLIEKLESGMFPDSEMENNEGKIFEVPKWEYTSISLQGPEREQLSELGKKGWEAFGIDNDRNNPSRIFLKRQIGTVRLMEVSKEQSPSQKRDDGYSR